MERQDVSEAVDDLFRRSDEKLHALFSRMIESVVQVEEAGGCATGPEAA